MGIYGSVIAEEIIAPDFVDEFFAGKGDSAVFDKEEEKNLFDRIAALNWGGLWENFSGWIEEINFIGMFASFGEAFIYFFTIITSFLG